MGQGFVYAVTENMSEKFSRSLNNDNETKFKITLYTSNVTIFEYNIVVYKMYIILCSGL